nr:hypothetical protein [uncultured Mucilaginibacter sp.]
MKKTLSLLVIALVICATGCKLDTPVFPEGTPKSDSYQPVTKGSYWKYNAISSGLTLTQTTTMTGATQTINGKLYYTANTTTGTQSENSYYYHGNGKYTFRSTTLMNGITLEFTYLTDNMAVGQKWTAPVTDDGTVNSFPAQLVGEVMERGISKVVSGKTFTDVVHTKLLLQYNITGAMETWVTYEFYTAKGVGLIQLDSSSLFGFSSSTTISSYLIK